MNLEISDLLLPTDTRGTVKESDSSDDRLVWARDPAPPTPERHPIKKMSKVNAAVDLPPRIFRRSFRGMDARAAPVDSKNAVRRVGSSNSSPANLDCTTRTKGQDDAETSSRASSVSSVDTSDSTRSLLKAMARGMQRALLEQWDTAGSMNNRMPDPEDGEDEWDEPLSVVATMDSSGELYPEDRWTTRSLSPVVLLQSRRSVPAIPRPIPIMTPIMPARTALDVVGNCSQGEPCSWESHLDKPIVCPRRKTSQGERLH